MALKEYTMTTVHGTETTVQLDAEDAERYGDRVKLVPGGGRKKATPENKSATPENKSAASIQPAASNA